MLKLLRVTTACENQKRLLLDVSNSEEAVFHTSGKRQDGQDVAAADAEILMKMKFM